VISPPRFWTSSTIAHPLDFPVRDMDSWLKIKHWYEYSEERFAPGWAEAARRARDEGTLIVCGMPGGFDTPRQLMGEAATCMAYYDQPELIHDILDTVGETAERVLDRVSREVQVDQISVHEDLAGKSGSLVGPRQIEAFTKFPPRQKPAAFNLDAVMRQLEEATSSKSH